MQRGKGREEAEGGLERERGGFRGGAPVVGGPDGGGGEKKNAAGAAGEREESNASRQTAERKTTKPIGQEYV